MEAAARRLYYHARGGAFNVIDFLERGSLVEQKERKEARKKVQQNLLNLVVSTCFGNCCRRRISGYRPSCLPIRERTMRPTGWLYLEQHLRSLFEATTSGDYAHLPAWKATILAYGGFPPEYGHRSGADRPGNGLCASGRNFRLARQQDGSRYWRIIGSGF